MISITQWKLSGREDVWIAFVFAVFLHELGPKAPPPAGQEQFSDQGRTEKPFDLSILDDLQFLPVQKTDATGSQAVLRLFAQRGLNAIRMCLVDYIGTFTIPVLMLDCLSKM